MIIINKAKSWKVQEVLYSQDGLVVFMYHFHIELVAAVKPGCINSNNFVFFPFVQHSEGLYSLNAVTRQLPKVRTAAQSGGQLEKRLNGCESLLETDRQRMAIGWKLKAS